MRVCIRCFSIHSGECGVRPEPEPLPPEKVCIHRGPQAGSASCGCGIMYHCDKLGGYCSDKRPHDELFTITLNLESGSVQLSEETYQCCGECGEFEAG